MPSYTKRKRKSGTVWYAVWDIGPDPVTGKRRQRYSPPQPTRAAARAWYDEHIAGKLTNYSALTVADYLDRWLATHRYHVRPITAQRYAQAIRDHIAPALGHIRLQDLKADAIRAWHTREIERGYKASTIGSWHMVLATALNQAVADGIISASPARHATPPQPADVALQHWTAAEIRRFLDGCPPDLNGMMFRFALLTGMRPGEIAALEWPQVDLESGVVSVEQTVTRGPDGRLTIGPPKTPASRRRVVMPDMLRQEMRAYRRLWLEARLLAGAAWDQEHEYVFPRRYGRRIYPNTAKRRFDRLCASLGLRPIPLHGLRHSWATWMLGLREHAAIVGAQLGHKSVSTTIDTYSHVSEDMQREAAARLDEDLRRHGS